MMMLQLTLDSTIFSPDPTRHTFLDVQESE